MTEDDDIMDGRKRFKRMYIVFWPIKKDFRNDCRPLIGLDGCHLNGPYGGQLLAAIDTDVNDDMYPITWVAVEPKKNESWNWFL